MQGEAKGLTYQSVRHLHLLNELKLLTTRLQWTPLNNIFISHCLKLGRVLLLFDEQTPVSRWCSEFQILTFANKFFQWNLVVGFGYVLKIQKKIHIFVFRPTISWGNNYKNHLRPGICFDVNLHLWTSFFRTSYPDLSSLSFFCSHHWVSFVPLHSCNCCSATSYASQL